MIKILKDFWGLISGWVVLIITWLIDKLDRVELVTLQKVFYISSIILIWIGIIQALTKHHKVKKEKKTLLETFVEAEKTNSLVQLAKNPERKGELVIKAFNILKIGGKNMKNIFKSLGRLQLASLILTLVLLALGVASAFVPELAPVAENLEAFFFTIGIVAIPGVLSQGKKIGDTAKQILPKKEVKQITKTIKTYQKRAEALAKKYAPVIEVFKDIQELGGTPTPEQQTLYNTYDTQRKALEAKINAEKNKLEVL